MELMELHLEFGWDLDVCVRVDATAGGDASLSQETAIHKNDFGFQYVTSGLCMYDFSPKPVNELIHLVPL